MSPENAKYYSVSIKVLNVILGIVIMVVGLYSFFQSEWKNIAGQVYESLPKLHQCGHAQSAYFIVSKDCPPGIGIEIFYVTIVTITFIFSAVLLVATVFKDIEFVLLQKIDLIYHMGASVLILIAATLYLSSAARIDKLFQGSKPDGFVWPTERNLLIAEKLAAGILSVAQSIIYGITSFFIYKNQMMYRSYIVN